MRVLHWWFPGPATEITLVWTRVTGQTVNFHQNFQICAHASTYVVPIISLKLKFPTGLLTGLLPWARSSQWNPHTRPPLPPMTKKNGPVHIKFTLIVELSTFFQLTLQSCQNGKERTGKKLQYKLEDGCESILAYSSGVLWKLTTKAS